MKEHLNKVVKSESEEVNDLQLKIPLRVRPLCKNLSQYYLRQISHLMKELLSFEQGYILSKFDSLHILLIVPHPDGLRQKIKLEIGDAAKYFHFFYEYLQIGAS